MENWKRRHIKQDNEHSEAYRAGYADHLECDSVVIYGRLNTSPSQAARDEWGADFRLYLMGWEAATRYSVP